jgi:hypothetical protein
MFVINTDKSTLSLKRNDVQAEFNFDPISGMMFLRQLPEYMQYLGMKHDNIWRKNDKKLLLIGGGESEIRAWLQRIGVCLEITNIDFYCEPNQSVSNYHIKEDFYDWKIPVDYYDQEWALWSLPAHSLSKTEVYKFFAKSAIGLAPNGVLRIFPINRGPGEISICKNEYTNEQRCKDSIFMLKRLEQLGFTVIKYYPNNMKNIVSVLENSTEYPYKTIYTLFKENVSERRCNYIQDELHRYQQKEINKAPFAVNIIAPHNPVIKQMANIKLSHYSK